MIEKWCTIIYNGESNTYLIYIIYFFSKNKYMPEVNKVSFNKSHTNDLFSALIGRYLQIEGGTRSIIEYEWKRKVAQSRVDALLGSMTLVSNGEFSSDFRSVLLDAFLEFEGSPLEEELIRLVGDEFGTEVVSSLSGIISEQVNVGQWFESSIRESQSKVNKLLAIYRSPEILSVLDDGEFIAEITSIVNQNWQVTDKDSAVMECLSEIGTVVREKFSEMSPDEQKGLVTLISDEIIQPLFFLRDARVRFNKVIDFEGELEKKLNNFRERLSDQSGLLLSRFHIIQKVNSVLNEIPDQDVMLWLDGQDNLALNEAAIDLLGNQGDVEIDLDEDLLEQYATFLVLYENHLGILRLVLPEELHQYVVLLLFFTVFQQDRNIHNFCKDQFLGGIAEVQQILISSIIFFNDHQEGLPDRQYFLYVRGLIKQIEILSEWLSLDIDRFSFLSTAAIRLLEQLDLVDLITVREEPTNRDYAGIDLGLLASIIDNPEFDVLTSIVLVFIAAQLRSITFDLQINSVDLISHLKLVYFGDEDVRIEEKSEEDIDKNAKALAAKCTGLTSTTEIENLQRTEIEDQRALFEDRIEDMNRYLDIAMVIQQRLVVFEPFVQLRGFMNDLDGVVRAMTELSSSSQSNGGDDVANNYALAIEQKVSQLKNAYPDQSELIDIFEKNIISGFSDVRETKPKKMSDAMLKVIKNAAREVKDVPQELVQQFITYQRIVKAIRKFQTEIEFVQQTYQRLDEGSSYSNRVIDKAIEIINRPPQQD